VRIKSYVQATFKGWIDIMRQATSITEVSYAGFYLCVIKITFYKSIMSTIRLFNVVNVNANVLLLVLFLYQCPNIG
jgi:hypothetical protein